MDIESIQGLHPEEGPDQTTTEIPKDFPLKTEVVVEEDRRWIKIPAQETTVEKYSKEIAKYIIKYTTPYAGGGQNFKGGNVLGGMEFNAGNLAIVSKNGISARAVPFIWQQDPETRQTWAVFTVMNFYGQPRPKWPPPEWAKTRIIITGFERKTDITMHTTGGYIAEFDETSITQKPMRFILKDEEIARRTKDLRMVSQDLALWRVLSKYTHPKINWMFLAVVVLIAGVLLTVLVYLHFHPGALQGLSHVLNLGGGAGGSTTPGSLI